MTRRYKSCFQDLINVWTMPTTMLKIKLCTGNSFRVSLSLFKNVVHIKDLCIFTSRTRLVHDKHKTSITEKCSYNFLFLSNTNCLNNLFFFGKKFCFFFREQFRTHFQSSPRTVIHHINSFRPQ